MITEEQLNDMKTLTLAVLQVSQETNQESGKAELSAYGRGYKDGSFELLTQIANLLPEGVKPSALVNECEAKALEVE